MRTVAGIVVLLAGASYTWGQAGSQASLQQVIASHISLTQVARDRSAIISAGSSLTTQKDNVLLYMSACPSSPINTYKNGKVSQSFGRSFLRDLGGSLQMQGDATTANCPRQVMARGTKVWVTRISVSKDGIVFGLYSTPDNATLYYGDLKVAFEKGAVPAPDEAMAKISEVMTIDTPGQASNAGSQNLSAGQEPVRRKKVAPGVATDPPPPPSPQSAGEPSALKLPSVYTNALTPADRLQLNADHTLSVQAGGQSYSGTFQVNGNSLAMTIADSPTSATLDGNKLTDASGQVWVLQEQSTAGGASGGVLQNQDIVKMVKAGLDDSLIVAKIGASKCQFDTSADGLIQLKQNGVSSAVMRAIMTK